MHIERLIQLLLPLVLLAGFSEKPESRSFAQNCPEVFVDIPAPKNLEEQETSFLCSETFALSFSHKTRTPLWVVERLLPENLAGPANRKYSKFKADPRLLEKSQASLPDYRNSGYDRGHMAPAGDLKFSQTAMDQSFFLSNIAPQVGAGFNRGIWRQLEEKVRDWVRQRGELYVITGPVFYDYTPVIGPSGVVVPDAFFKIIYDPETEEAFAFLVPNQVIKGANYFGFLTTVFAIEAETGLDLRINHLEN